MPLDEAVNLVLSGGLLSDFKNEMFDRFGCWGYSLFRQLINPLYQRRLLSDVEESLRVDMRFRYRDSFAFEAPLQRSAVDIEIFGYSSIIPYCLKF